MNYWVIIDGIEQGPFSLIQVREMHLSPATPVWCTGMPDWVTAAELPELAEWLSIPEPASAQACDSEQNSGHTEECTSTTPAEPMPPTYLAWSIVATLLCCLIPGVIAIIFSAKVEPRWHKGDIQGAKNASDWALLWIIAAVIFAIIGLPLQLTMMSF